jgi:dolichyl-phosphate beta-glucosyltransferase
MSQRLESWIEKQVVTAEPVELSVVVPAYNEERRLPPTLIDMIDFLDSRGDSYEVIVVDDGSSDLTADVARKFERVRSQVRLIQLARNSGKGHAVRVGVLNSRGARILFADADGATPIKELTRLTTALDEGADVAVGSRAKASKDTKVRTSFHRKFLGRIFNGCVNAFILPGIADTQCGFKIFTRDAAQFLFRHQRSDGFSFDVELLFIARRVGFTIQEVPVNWRNIPGSKVSLVWDSARMLRDIFRFRFLHRHISKETFKNESSDGVTSGAANSDASHKRA